MKKYLLALCLLFAFGLSYSQEDKEIDKKVPQEESDTIDIDDIDFDDIDFDDIEEDELSKESDFPWEKFAIGGQIGNLQFGDQTAVALAPEVLYNVTDVVAVGVDGIYELYKIKRFFNQRTRRYESTNYREENIGGRLFTRVKPMKTFPVFAQFEYEKLNEEKVYGQFFDQSTGQSVFPSVEQNLNSFGAGLGFYNGPSYIALIYNLNNKANKDSYLEKAAEDFSRLSGNTFTAQDMVNQFRSDEYYTNALKFRVGYNIPLGQGNKNKKRDKNKKKKDKDEPTREN